MYKNVLQSIENIDIWPIISLSIFFIFFLCMALWWWQMDKEHIKKMARMPLEDSDDNDTARNDLQDNRKDESVKKSSIQPSLKAIFTLILVVLGQPLFAQTSSNNLFDSTTLFFIIAGAVILVSILVLVVAIYLLMVLKTLLVEEKKKKATEEGIEYVPEPSFWQKFNQATTDAVPVEQEETILLDHEYDGIRELDNHLPPWWKWLFYASIIWSIIYLFAYHVIEILPLQTEEYEIEVAEAEAAAAIRLASAEESGTAIDENNVQFVTDDAALADGEKVYQTNCAPCHKADGGGSIGPNMTDEYWLHGGGIKEIFSTVKYGVVEKGMIPWEPVLTPVQMQNVSSFILTLQGTNPPNAKEAQGELWVDEEE